MTREYLKSDYKEVSSWFHRRNLPITEDYLPATGFIVPKVAAGFIFKTDSNFCVFECFISNPNTEKIERENALREIVSHMIKKAKDMGYRNAYGFATSQTMIRLGIEQGFKFIETASTICKDLR